MTDIPQEASAHDVEKTGERTISAIEIGWVRDGIQVPEGTMIGQHKLVSEAAEEYAALHLVRNDLLFASDCFVEADKLGIPDVQNTLSKALIFAGATAYARCFKGGVRTVKLTTELLAVHCAGYDAETHEYLIALRDKHVAHSVNSFERCETFGVVFAQAGESWREGYGVGVVSQSAIGLNRIMLRAATEHMKSVTAWVTGEIVVRRIPLYAEFTEAWSTGANAQMVPVIKMEDRKNVAVRRK